jgi:hypothetical protein
MAFCFLQWLSDFFNGFPIFLNGFPIFLNGFLLSEKSEKIYLQRQVYKRSPFKLCISRHSLPELCNPHLLPELCNHHSLPKLCNCHRSPSFVIASIRASHPTACNRVSPIELATVTGLRHLIHLKVYKEETPGKRRKL